jgi:hypothetical protein
MAFYFMSLYIKKLLGLYEKCENHYNSLKLCQKSFLVARIISLVKKNIYTFDKNKTDKMAV